ncbi:MAG: glyoxylate/hydroxypyruvate reductase A [Elainellaceae cyanobacterium]
MRAVIPFVSQLGNGEAKAWLETLRAALPEHDLLPLAKLTAEQRAIAQVAIVANPHPADLAALPQVKWVQSLWAGVERLVADTQGCDFAIVPMQDPQLAATMAEAVLAWTLYLHRDMPRYRTQQSAHLWQPQPLTLSAQRTVGLLGLGNLGQAAAHTLVRQGFRVWGWRRSPIAIDGVHTVSGCEGLHQVLEQSHILVCLLPLTPETQGLLSHETLGRLPKGASLINFARGTIVDIDALVSRLDSGHLDHAVLDVFDREPLSPKSSLWDHPSITVLPHISAPTNKQTASQIVAQNIRRFWLTGELPPTVDRDLGY